jgi:hypothetical protein
MGWSPHRKLFLEKLPKNGVVAEVGVWLGGHAWSMYNIMRPSKFYLVDIWQYQDIEWDTTSKTDRHNEALEKVKKRFQGCPEIEIVQDYSVPAAARFEDSYFDAVYIDADHSYDAVKADISAWWPKVKSGGFISGHDYLAGKKHINVKPAVDEFIKDNGLEMAFTSPCSSPDWAVRKP